MRLWVGNSNVVELDDLENTVTELHDAGATVTVTLLDSAGEEVSGHTWPLAMAYNATDEVYRVTLSENLGITAGEIYTVVVRAVGSGAEVGSWTDEVRAKIRTGC